MQLSGCRLHRHMRRGSVHELGFVVCCQRCASSFAPLQEPVISHLAATVLRPGEARMLLLMAGRGAGRQWRAAPLSLLVSSLPSPHCQILGCLTSGTAQYTEDSKALVVRTLVVDTLALANRFESAGLDRRPAELLAQYITEVIVINKAKADDMFVDKRQLEKVVIEQEMRITAFKNELQKAQDVQSGNLGKELERQQTFLEKMRAETRHEIDKLVSSQRLDMNLEKGRMRDDLQSMRDKSTDLEIKVDRDFNELKSSVEKAKNDTIKSVITILGTFSAIAFTISRFIQMGAGNG